MSRVRIRAALIISTLVGAGLVPISPPAANADAYVYWPGVVSGVRVTAQTPTSFTVGLNAAAHASYYRVAASTLASDIWMVNINKATTRRVGGWSATPSVTVRNLSYTAAPFYYRVATINGPHVRWSSAFHQAYLAASTPTGLTGHAGTDGTYLTWTSPAASGYTIEQATDAAFSTGIYSYVTSDDTHRFTPTGLLRGRPYWFRIRSRTGTTASSYSAAVSVTPVTAVQQIRTVTYNSLSSTFDGSPIHATLHQPSWWQRRPGQVALLRGANADVIAIQEAGPVVSRTPFTLQVNSIANGLGSDYAVANSDPGPNNGGNYVLYRRSTISQVGTGGCWQLGYAHTATYQLLRTKSTGATFLYVTPHLDSVRGPVYDAQRRVETDTMITDAKAYAKYHQVTSIVYGGDTNSWPGRWETTDTPGLAMQRNLTTDTFAAARYHTSAQYASINLYTPTPALGGSADRQFVTGGIAVAGWGELLNLYQGKFLGVIPSDHNPVYADIQLPY